MDYDRYALRPLLADLGPIVYGQAGTVIRPVEAFTPHGAEEKR